MRFLDFPITHGCWHAIFCPENYTNGKTKLNSTKLSGTRVTFGYPGKSGARVVEYPVPCLRVSREQGCNLAIVELRSCKPDRIVAGYQRDKRSDKRTSTKPNANYWIFIDVKQRQSCCYSYSTVCDRYVCTQMARHRERTLRFALAEMDSFTYLIPVTHLW